MTDFRVAFASEFLRNNPDFPNTADSVKKLTTKMFQSSLLNPSYVTLTDADVASAMQATHTGVQLACILPARLDTLRLHSRKFNIRPKTDIPGATQLRFNFWDAASLLIVSKLTSQGATTTAIRQFLEDYSHQVNFENAIDGAFLLVTPAKEPARVIFFDKTQVDAARDSLLRCGVQHAEISLAQVYRELIEKIHCHNHTIDYQELADAQLRKQLADWEEAFAAHPTRKIHAELLAKREK